MSNPDWNGSQDDWTTARDWSGGAVPAAGDAVSVDSGRPDITGDDGTVGSVAVGTGGTITFESGALATTGDVQNDGALDIDAFAAGDSRLGVGGTLTNTGTVTAGDFYGSVQPTLSLGALDNTATGNVDVYGASAAAAELTVTGATTDDGSILLEGGGGVFSGNVTGTGTIYLGRASSGSGARVELGAASNVAINFEGDGTGILVLDDPAGFTGQLQELGIGTTIDLAGVDATSATVGADDATLTVAEASGATLTYALSTAQGYALPGDTTFATTPDGNGGTDLVLTAGAPASIAAPASETVTEGTATALAGLSIADPDPKAGTITVVIDALSGSLAAAQAGGGSVIEGDTYVEVSGTLAEVNAELASVTYTAPLRTTAATSTSDQLYLRLSDQDGQQVSQTIPVTIGVGPVAVTVPASASVQEGIASSLGSLSLADATTSAGAFSVVLTSQSGTLSATQAGAATVVGEASGQLTLSGSLADVNAELASVAYVGVAPSGSADTASDQVSVVATDPNGFRDQQTVGITVDTAPYDHFQAAADALSSDALAFVPQSQILTDALGVEAGAVSGAIGTLAGTPDQSAFDQSAATAASVGGSPAGSPAAYGDVVGFYDSLLEGAVGTVAADIPALQGFALSSNLIDVFDSAQTNPSYSSLELTYLQQNIEGYYADLSGGSAVSAAYQAAYQASLSNAATLGTDFQAQAGYGQILADTSDLYTGLIDGALGSVVPTATQSTVQTTLATLKTDVDQTTVSQPTLLADVANVYKPLVAQSVSATADPNAVSVFDQNTATASLLGEDVSTANVPAILDDTQDLYTLALPTIAGLGSGPVDVNTLIGTFSGIVHSLSNGASLASVEPSASNILAQILGPTDSVEYQAFEAAVAEIPPPSSTTDLGGTLTYITKTFEALTNAAALRSPATGAALLQSLQAVAADLQGGAGDPSSAFESFLSALLGQGAATPTRMLRAGPTADISADASSATTQSNGASQQDAVDASIGTIFGVSGINDTQGWTTLITPIAITAGSVYLGEAAAAGLAEAGISAGVIAAAPAVITAAGITAAGLIIADYIITHNPSGDITPQQQANWNNFKKNPGGSIAGGAAGVAGRIAHALGFGDVHLTTFSGQYYNFQAEGEFVLARSTQPSNTFQIQARLQPWQNSSAVTVTTELAAQVGADRVTFDVDRPNTVWIDGQASALSATNGIVNLAGGQIVELSPTSFQLTWKTGESMTVTNAGTYLNYSIALGPNDGPGSVQGLLGTDESQANDFTLPDGTILPQNLTSAQLYGAFADGWRVTQATSLLDYAPGQTTADFTNTDFPTSAITLADLPADVVAKAAQLAAAAGITDPNLAAGAELDYIATGDASFVGSAADAQQLGTTTTAAPVTPSAAPTPEIGVSAVQASVTPAAGQPVDVSFEVYLTGALTTDTTIAYTLSSSDPGALGAAAFGGTAPSGTVTIAAGQTTGTFTITVPADVLGQAPTASLVVGISSPGGLPVFAATSATTLVNPTPEPGAAPQPTVSALSNVGTLTGSGTAYTLDLGTVVEGESIPALQFAVNNTADGLADQLAGTLGVSTAGAGFTAIGTGTLSPIAGGASDGQIYVIANPATLGASSETLTLLPTDVNASGYSANLPAITLTVKDDVIAPAQAQLNTPTTVSFGAVRQGATIGQAVSVTNAAAAGAAGLDVTATANGGALTSGTISGLAPDATDASDITVGMQTAVAGPTSGEVTLDETSDAGGGNTATLAGDTIQVSGAVYREAALSVAPATAILHVGDPGTVALDVTNSDPADGYSESLAAALVGTTGPGTVSGSLAGEIAPGATSTALTLQVSTAVAGTVPAGETFSVSTDGTGIDGFGPTSLGTQTVSTPITVDNDAEAALSETSGGGTWTQDGANYTLNLGDIAQNSGSLAIDLAVGNAAGGPADLLSGSFTTAGSSAFTTSGFGAVSGLGAEASANAGTVTLDTSKAGQFTETVTLDATGSNASGYSGALAPETLTITGTVGGAPAPPVLTAPTAVTVTGATATSLGALSVADSNVGAAPLTVTLSDLSGTLDATGYGAGTVTGDGTDALVLTGSLAEIDQALSSLTYTGLPVPGQAGSTIADTLKIAATDAAGQTASAAVAITDAQAPLAGPVVTAPTSIPTAVGVPTTLNGISVSDPYVTSIGGTDAVTIAFPDAVLNATGPGIATGAGSPGVVVTGQGTASLTLTGTPAELNQVLLGDVTGTLASDGSSGSVSVAPGSGPYDFIDFAKTDNIQKALLPPFPTGIVVADNAIETPFDITADASGNTFNDAEGASLTIPVDIPKADSEPGGGGVEEVDMLVGAYDAPTGAGLETVEFDGVDGSNNAVREVFTLVDGQTVRDVFQTSDPSQATTLDPSAAAPQALPAFTFSNTKGGGTADGGGTGNAATGATGTYDVDEQRFVLDPDFQTASLQQIVITPEAGGGTPLLFGVTLRETPSVLDAGETQDSYADRVKKILNPDEPDPPEPPVNPPPPPSTGGGSSGQENGHNGKPSPPQGPISVTATAQGDVHITTYDGLYYNFQAEGEFVLTKATAADDTFQVQVRLQPWFASASVSVITEAAVQVGTDRVTFDTTRPDLVYVDGVATQALTGPNASLALNGGTLTETAAGQYLVAENTGETVAVADEGSFLDVTPGLAANQGAGSVEGLLGTDSGQATDFQASNGTVLQQPLTSAQLYGTFANSWRVTQATSLLDYGPGQTTASFTDTAFPSDALSLADLPAAVVAKAAATVAAAGITDPTIAAGAELDYIATGDLGFVTSAAASQGTTPVTQAVVTSSTAPAPSIGVSAAAVSAPANAAGTTPVDFDFYLTSAATTATEIDYTVEEPDAADLGASAFGGTLPSGEVVIGAGGTSAAVEIDVPAGALGTLGSAGLQLSVSSPSGLPVFASTASTTLVNPSVPPAATAIALSRAGADLGAGQSVQITLMLDQPVSVTGAPTLLLNDGGTATYAGSGTGFTPSLVFDTTVAAGQNASSLAASTLQLGSATIVNAAGTALATSLSGLAQLGPTIDTTVPSVSSPTLTVVQNSGPAPIRIAAPSDNLTPAGSLVIAIGSLPTDGTVTLADGTTPVTTGESLTAAQLTGLEFTPTPGVSDQGSTFSYTVTDGAGNQSTGTAALAIGAPGAPIVAGTHATTDQAEAPVAPFAGVTVSDPGAAAGATDGLAIALSGGGGTLSGDGLTGSGDSYTLAATDPATLSSVLDALQFTPANPTPGATAGTTFTVTVSSSSGTSATDSGTTVADTAATVVVDTAAPPPPPTTPDSVSIAPQVSYKEGVFTLTGTASSPAGIRSVEISALVDGARQDLGAATVDANGTFDFADLVGGQQTFFVATETDGEGGQATSADPGFNLSGGLGPNGRYGEQDSFSPSAQVSTAVYRPNGQRFLSVEAAGQVVDLGFDDIVAGHRQGGTDFVFSPGDGLDVIGGFKSGGADHDTLDLPSADFRNFADVLRNTGDVNGSAFITDPVTGDAIRLAGVTMAALKRKDFTFND